MRLLDAREQEDAVVGREPERDREQQHRLARLQAHPGSSKPSSPSRWPSWKISTSRPNAAVSVSRFITSALIGSTTDPVIRNRMTSVVVARIASAIGSESPSAFCWSRKRRGLAADPRPAPVPSPRARRARVSLAALAQRPAARDHVDPVEAARLLHARLADDARQRAESLHVALDRRLVARRRHARRRRSASCGWAGTRSRAPRRRRAPSGRGGSTLASTPVNLMPRNGSPSAISSAAAPAANGTGRRMIDVREAVPEAAALAGRVAVQRGLPALRAERVHARAERGEDRGQQRQRHQRGRRARRSRRRPPSSRGSAAGTRAATASAAATVIDENSTVRPGGGHRARAAPPRCRGRARAPRGSARP